MERLAIIIKGFSKSDHELEHDRLYVNYYRTFLRSSAGGGWQDEEIRSFEEPSINDLQELVDSTLPEFVLLIMIGHGASQNSNQLFELQENIVIQAGQLTLDVNKQLVILESCRTRLNGIKTVSLGDRIPQFRDGGVVRAAISLEESRRKHLNLLNQCGNGLVVCYACGENQKAANYYFSKSILTRAFEWHLGSYNQYLPISNLMIQVVQDLEEITKRHIEIQSPSITGNINFPFAISKF